MEGDLLAGVVVVEVMFDGAGCCKHVQSMYCISENALRQW